MPSTKELDELYVEQDFPSDEDLGYHGADEVPAGHPDELDYQGSDVYGGQPCPHAPHWRHCAVCNPDEARAELERRGIAPIAGGSQEADADTFARFRYAVISRRDGRADGLFPLHVCRSCISVYRASYTVERGTFEEWVGDQPCCEKCGKPIPVAEILPHPATTTEDPNAHA